MPEPAPDTATVIATGDEWRRLDARMLLVHPVREFARYIPFLFVAFMAGRANSGGHWWGLIGLGVVMAVSIVRWATTGYRITPEQVQLRTGLLRKRVITTPADRVRTVDVVERPLHRVLGLAAVSIGTGTATRKEGGLELDGLPRAAALALRQELLHRSSAPPVSTQPPSAAAGVPGVPGVPPELRWLPPVPPPDEETQILALDPRWVRFAPFTLSGAVTAAAVVGFSWNLAQQANVDTGRIGPVRAVVRYLKHSPGWAVAVQVGIALVVIVSALAVVGYVLAYWNYRLSRHTGGSIGVRRGLLTTRNISIEHRRLRGIELVQTLLLRWVSGARLVAVATGLKEGRGRDRGSNLLVPPAPLSIVAATAGAMLDAPGGNAALHARLIGHGRLALRRRLVRAVVPVAALEVAALAAWNWSGLAGWVPAAGLVLVAGAVLIGRDRYHSLAHAVVGRYLVVRNGSFVRRRVALDSEGIIGWEWRQTLFQRRLGLVTLIATTAAGRQSYHVVDVDIAESLTIVTAATPGIAEQFAAAESS